MQRAKKNYLIYAVMLLLFGALIYMAIEEGDRFSYHAVASSTVAEDTPFTMFCQFVTDNLHHPLSIFADTDHCCPADGKAFRLSVQAHRAARGDW